MMMCRGEITGSAASPVPFSHQSWGYRDRAEFLARAAEYIAAGLAHNHRVEYVGAGSRDELRAELAGLPGLADRLDDIEVTPMPEFYTAAPGTDIVDPQRAVAARVAAVEQAIKQGYAGLRAVCDATTLAHRPEQRDALACFEFLLDQQMAVRPASALCCYDLNQLADGAPDLICLHPFVGPQAPTFQLYAQPGVGFALAGEIDAADARVFATTLQRIWPLAAGETVVVDAQRLEFISHPPLVVIDHWLRTSGSHVVLRTSQRIPTRLVELLQLTNVQVELPAGADAGTVEAWAEDGDELPPARPCLW